MLDCLEKTYFVSLQELFQPAFFSRVTNSEHIWCSKTHWCCLHPSLTFQAVPYASYLPYLAQASWEKRRFQAWLGRLHVTMPGSKQNHSTGDINQVCNMRPLEESSYFMYSTCMQSSFQHDPGVTRFISCKDKLTSCTLCSHSKAIGKSKQSRRAGLWEQTKKVPSK